MAKQIVIFAANDCYASSLAGFTDSLDAANIATRRLWKTDENFYSWKLCSIDGEPIRCSHGLQIAVDDAISRTPISYSPKPTLIVIPPMAGNRWQFEEQLAANRRHIQWLKKHHTQFESIVSHCSGSFLLAEAGLLDNEDVTTTWWLSRQFQQRYPKIKLCSEKRLVESGRFIIGGSSSCYRETALKLVQNHCGSEISRMLSKFLLMDKAEGNQNIYTVPLSVSSNNKALQKAVDTIMENLGQPLSIETIAEKSAVTSRTLGRYFQQEFACSPQKYIQHMRIEKSKILLETTALNLHDVANRCGYSDENAFRRLFKRHCEISPNEYRRAFASH